LGAVLLHASEYSVQALAAHEEPFAASKVVLNVSSTHPRCWDEESFLFYFKQNATESGIM